MQNIEMFHGGSVMVNVTFLYIFYFEFRPLNVGPKVVTTL